MIKMAQTERIEDTLQQIRDNLSQSCWVSFKIVTSFIVYNNVVTLISNNIINGT